MATHVICASSARSEVRALDWLTSHGALIDPCLDILVVRLPEHARMTRDGKPWRYCIEVYRDGNPLSTYVEMEMVGANVAETVLRLIEPEQEQPEDDELRLFVVSPAQRVEAALELPAWAVDVSSSSRHDVR